MPTTPRALSGRGALLLVATGKHAVQVFREGESGMSVSHSQADLSGVAANLQNALSERLSGRDNYSVKTTGARGSADSATLVPTMLVLAGGCTGCFCFAIACAKSSQT